MAVHFERIPSTDPRMGRHIHHDDRSCEMAAALKAWLAAKGL